MKKITVSRDDRYHEAWPSVTIASNGDLVVSYSEADTHGGGPVSSAVVRISKDQGHTWSEPIVVETLTDRQEEGFLLCRAIITLQDGSLLLACDWFPCNYTLPPGAMHRWGTPFSEVWLYRSFDNGKTWSKRERTEIRGAESLTLTKLNDGTVIIAGCQFVREGEYSYQVIWRSVDNGHTWEGPITVLHDPDYIFCEGHPVELPGGELVMYIRENRVRTGTGTKAISYDKGLTWEGPFSAGKWPIVGRVSAGMLSSGEILVLHRVGGFAVPGNTFGYFVDSVDSALSKTPYKNREEIKHSLCLSWGIIDRDLSPFCDAGYGGWVELPSKEIFAVNYIVDDAPRSRPQIRGYFISRDELLNPTRDIVFDFESPLYKRGILAGQNGWVQQTAGYWNIGNSFTGREYVDNFILIDNSGKHSYSGKASITGSRNRNGGPQVVRRDIGPFDLREEEVEISFIHSGKQYWGIFQVLDAGGRVIIEVHSDFVYEPLYVKYNRSKIVKSNINTENDWWETKMVFSKDETKVYTKNADDENFGDPWFVNQNTDIGSYVIDNAVNKDLVGIGFLKDVVSAIAIVLGGKGNWYIDKISVNSRSRKDFIK